MSFIEVYYNPASCDWDLQADAALKQIDFTPTVILLYPLESGDQLPLFKTNGEKTDGLDATSAQISD